MLVCVVNAEANVRVLYTPGIVSDMYNDVTCMCCRWETVCWSV